MSSIKKRKSVLKYNLHCPMAKDITYNPEIKIARKAPNHLKDIGYDHSREDEYDGDEEPSGPNVTHGYHKVRGKMDHGMEDYLVAENREIDGHELGLYAIFDGHSGSDVARYLQANLFDNILSQPDFWKNQKRATKRAYKDTDTEKLENVVGSTAVTAILIDKEKLVVANVGESRAILCRTGRPKQITVDHEPKKETELVESKGAFVSEKPGNVPRVDGQLAMTRAFGDRKVKEHITSEPDFRIEKIGTDAEFIILASDGLWKVMSNEEACSSIKGMDTGEEAAKKLIKEALDRGSKDDISCIVVVAFN